ncbi:toll/interleukin-1 receptor domain-containing protein [Cohnella mopanensis]|uniref:toll/interleukin-1 receptor domain-containing protein n=1 Tax=Cohnella mopanensis TaxID=2911966 RepID=UPI001EF79506|nr:toll/interleukin-1 receptor domain-containing protein [Cohnella mopanensis]
MAKIIFLSHIHEERDLALLIKSTIEEEFSGFVDVFVSSDGISIPAGSNFLNKIEDGLMNCNAAIVLLSPHSVSRSWINFELGSVWIRNKLSSETIPVIPFCHSGMTLNAMPQPINQLNAIQGNIASQLEFAFNSIQKAVGGKGSLKTNFTDLASKVQAFEDNYTVGDKLSNFFRMFAKSTNQVYQLIDDNPHTPKVILGLGTVELDNAKKLIEGAKLIPDYISVNASPSRLQVDSFGTRNLCEVELLIDTDIMKKFRKLLEY